MHQFMGYDADLGNNAMFYFNLSDTHDPLPFTLNSTGYLWIFSDIDLETIVNQQCDTPHYFVCTNNMSLQCVLLAVIVLSLLLRLLIMVQLTQLTMLDHLLDTSTSPYLTSMIIYHDSQIG